MISEGGSASCCRAPRCSTTVGSVSCSAASPRSPHSSPASSQQLAASGSMSGFQSRHLLPLVTGVRPSTDRKSNSSMSASVCLNSSSCCWLLSSARVSAASRTSALSAGLTQYSPILSMKLRSDSSLSLVSRVSSVLALGPGWCLVACSCSEWKKEEAVSSSGSVTRTVSPWPPPASDWGWVSAAASLTFSSAAAAATRA